MRICDNGYIQFSKKMLLIGNSREGNSGYVICIAPVNKHRLFEGAALILSED